MKRHLLLLLTILSIGIAGCSKEEKTRPDHSTDITGRWFVTDILVAKKWTPVKGSCLDGMYAEFSKELIYKSFGSCTDDNYSGTYTRSGDVVSCKVGANTVTYRIIELTGDNSTLEMNDGGEPMRIKAKRR